MTRNETQVPLFDTSIEACAIRPAAANPTARMRAMVDGQYDAVWRTARFLGVPDASADDVAQQVFCIAARRLSEIAPGAERSFLLSTAWRVASEHRRAERRRPMTSGADVDALEAPLPSPEELLDLKRARIALQSVIAAMPTELRMVFVLYEIEELSLPEIAAVAGVPLGTVTSRLRRAREAFQSIVKRKSAAARSVREGEP